MVESERFLRALKEYKGVIAAGGFSHDDTVDKAFESQKALINNIFAAGYSDGLSKEYIRQRVEDVAGEAYGKKLVHRTLYEMLQGIVSMDPETRTLPHEKVIARFVFNQIMQKFGECTVEERRTITRSDEEFYEIMKGQIATRAGFKMKECFGDLQTLAIPRKPRGNELFWCELGDPEAEPSVLDGEFQHLSGIIIGKFQELHPDLFEKLEYAEKLKTMTLKINTSHQDKIDELQNALDEGQKGNDYHKFDELALPVLINGLIMSFLVKKDNYFNTHERMKIYKNILNAVNKELESED